jgi:hypothetical protein
MNAESDLERAESDPERAEPVRINAERHPERADEATTVLIARLRTPVLSSRDGSAGVAACPRRGILPGRRRRHLAVTVPMQSSSRGQP